MIVFLRLLIAHMLTDFVILRDESLALRRKGVWAYLLHAGVFMACVTALCLGFMRLPWLTIGGHTLNGWQLFIPLAGAHLLIDYFDKSQNPAYPGRKTLLFILWQAVAVSVLFYVFPPLSVQQQELVSPLAYKFLIFSAGALFVTYFLSAFIYIIDHDFSRCGPLIADEKYMGMLMRLVLFLLLLAPGWAGWVLGGAWLVFMEFALKYYCIDISRIRKAVALPLTAAAGILVRFLI